MGRKKANEAAVPLVSGPSAGVVRKSRKKDHGPATANTQDKAASAEGVTKPPSTRRKSPAARRRTKMVATEVAVSISNLAEAVELSPALETGALEERAYLLWLERGCPVGSPEEDWFRAEQELKALASNTSQ
jgi:Protein of unknown function (DUF2934)